MAKIVPERAATHIRSETYRPSPAERARTYLPLDATCERGRRLVREDAHAEGRLWREAGYKKSPFRAGIPAWASNDYRAGYEEADAEIAARAEGIANVVHCRTGGSARSNPASSDQMATGGSSAQPTMPT